MDLGTSELFEDVGTPKKRRRPMVGGSSGSGPGGNGSGGGGGSDSPKPDGRDDADTLEGYSRDKSRILMWFLLLVVLMTFGGLISAYIVISTNNVAEWQPTTLPIQVWISTAIILASSVTYYLAERAIIANDHAVGKKYLIATTVLGAMFISSQVLGWLELSRRGLYMQGNPYVGFFYLLTAVHAVHVIGGITGLASILLQSWYPTSTEDKLKRRVGLAQVVGWYWHFMGLLWIVLFILLGFWK